MTSSRLATESTGETRAFERREAARRDAFEAGLPPLEIDGIEFGKDEFGGLADAFTFPITVALAAIALAMLSCMVLVETHPEWIIDHFVTIAAVTATLITIPLATIAGIREHRKWRSYEELRSLASLDPLTGLMNRRSFSASLDVELKRMTRTRHLAAVILFDLDHFKNLNDQFGHAIGDEVLTRVASIAYSELRNPFDRLGRWGGEEFIILLHDMNEDTARGVCDRLRQRIEELIITADGTHVPVAASFGGSLLRPNQPFSEALHHADVALYEAKENGRNQVVFKRSLQLAV